MGHTLGATRNDVDDDDDDGGDDDDDDEDDDDEDGTLAVHTPLSQSKIFDGIGKNRYWSVIIILS